MKDDSNKSLILKKQNQPCMTRKWPQGGGQINFLREQKETPMIQWVFLKNKMKS
jgi:hypothetical protein